MEVDWIGWRISLASWLISIPDTKIRKIMSQVHSLMAQTKVPIKELQSLVRRLLWLTSAWHYLRPLLVPLYKALEPATSYHGWYGPCGFSMLGIQPLI